MRFSKIKKGVVIVPILLVLFFITEFIMRHSMGFCDSPLYVANEKYEYICAPNQDRHRFGHHIYFNSFSQRSDEPDSSKIIVLGLGDSVINGGVLTNNEDLATTLAGNSRIQILNISAGSWGPDNCAAYLAENGTFNAKMILLVVSSHDAYDNMTFEPVVGIHESFPDRQYLSAIVELFDRYVIRWFKNNDHKKLNPDQKVLNGVGIDKRVNNHANIHFNPGFDKIKKLSDSLSVPFCIYLHPDVSEMKDRSFNSQGAEIIAWAKKMELN